MEGDETRSLRMTSRQNVLRLGVAGGLSHATVTRPGVQLWLLLAWILFYGIAITSVALIIFGMWQGPHRRAVKTSSAGLASQPEVLKHEPLP